jgi:hypothetical protein
LLWLCRLRNSKEKVPAAKSRRAMNKRTWPQKVVQARTQDKAALRCG